MKYENFKILKIYATTPESEPQRKARNTVVNGLEYFDEVKRVAKWSEDCKFEGTLIYANNSLVDGWSVAQIVLEHTEDLTPLVAVNPIYIPPYSLAKNIASLSFMYNKRIDINWIAGGFKGDLKSLGDETPHDLRYERLQDYASLIMGLLSNKGLYSHEGDFYKVDKVKLMPLISEDLIPKQLISGTSEAGIKTATMLGALKVKYAKPIEEYDLNAAKSKDDMGVRFGIIARNTSDEAWKIAKTRFPDDNTGRMAHVLATKASDSKWHSQLSEIETKKEANDTYWLKPFQTYKTFCPYLVGSHEQVAEQLIKYVKLGHTSIILDIMLEKEDFDNCYQVFRRVEDYLVSN